MDKINALIMWIVLTIFLVSFFLLCVANGRIAKNDARFDFFLECHRREMAKKAKRNEDLAIDLSIFNED